MKTKLDLKQIREGAEGFAPEVREIIESLCEEIEELEPYPNPGELLEGAGKRILQLEKEVRELRRIICEPMLCKAGGVVVPIQIK